MNPEPDTDPGIQVIKNCNLFMPRPPGHPALQKMKYSNFFSISVGHFCPPRSGFRDPTASGSKPDPEDPVMDTDPQHRNLPCGMDSTTWARYARIHLIFSCWPSPRFAFTRQLKKKGDKLKGTVSPDGLRYC